MYIDQISCKSDMLRAVIALFLVVVLMYGVDVHAETNADSTGVRTYYLDEVVVTAATKERKAIDVPANVTFITSEDIEEGGYRSTPEIIGSLPGLIDQANGESYYYDFRGTKSSDSQGTHILIDGREVNLGMFGFNIIGSIPLEIIDKIEVVKTPGSYLAGRNSSRGVINIITKNGAAYKKPFSVEMLGSYGSWNSQHESLTMSGTMGRLGYFTNFSSKRSQGYAKTDPKYMTFMGSLDYAISDNLSLGVDLQFNDEDRQYTQGKKQWMLDRGYRRDDKIPSSAGDSSYMKKPNTVENTSMAGTLSIDYDNNDYRAGVRLNISDYEDTYEKHTYDNKASSRKNNYLSERTQDIYEIKLYGGRDVELGESSSNTIDLGYEYSHRSSDQKRAYPWHDDPDKGNNATIDFEENYNAVYLRNVLSVDRFRLATGLRGEFTDVELSSKKPADFSNDFSRAEWNVAPSYYVIPNGNLYFSVSQSSFYPAPGYYYYAMDKNDIGNKVEDIKPETTLSYEVGFKHNHSRLLSYAATAFYMKVEDRFLTFYNDAGSWKGWKNVGDSINKGFELEGEGRPISQLGYNFSFTYIDAEWDSGALRLYKYGATPDEDAKVNRDISGKTVVRIPTYQMKTGLNYYTPVEGLRTHLGLTVRGDEYIDEWNRYEKDPEYLVDAKVMYELPQWAVYVSCQNLFDKEYNKVFNTGGKRNSDGTPDYNYYPKPGRYVEFGVRVKY